jgi:hypothetical protein
MRRLEDLPDRFSAVQTLSWSVGIMFALWAIYLEAIPFFVGRGSFHRPVSAPEAAVITGLVLPLIVRIGASLGAKAYRAVRWGRRAT